MNFETAFARYQAGTASAEETALVEQELEKYRLIEDYMAAQALPPLPEDTAAQTETAAIKRRLGRRTRRTVLMAVAATLAVLALLHFVLSPLVNRGVYGQRVERAAGYQPFDAAMTAVTGLYMPLGSYTGSTLTHSGFMTDTLHLQFWDLTGETRFGIRTGVTLRLGMLGELDAADLLPLHYAVVGYFTSAFDADGTELEPSDGSLLALKEMSDQLTVTAAVRFRENITAEELSALMSRHPELTFLSGKVENQGAYLPQSLFCSLTDAGIDFGDALEQEYPLLQLHPDGGRQPTGAEIQQHFESMVRLLLDHPRLVAADSMMGNDAGNYRRLLQDVQANGLLFGGVWVQGTPSQLLSLMDEDCTRSISSYSARLRLSVSE